MSEIAKCPICGKEPGWHDFDIEARIFGGERSYFCCGMKASAAVLWNQYAAAMELAKRHKELDNYKGVNPNIVTDLVHGITVAEHYVLEVFK